VNDLHSEGHDQVEKGKGRRLRGTEFQMKRLARFLSTRGLKLVSVGAPEATSCGLLVYHTKGKEGTSAGMRLPLGVRKTARGRGLRSTPRGDSAVGGAPVGAEGERL